MQRILIAGNVHEKLVEITPTYVRAVRAVGAVGAVSFAQSEQDASALAAAFDALILPGGNDLPAQYFGQTPHVACGYDDPMRDTSDRLLLDAFRAAGKRILGICRGCQVTNVHLGGTLHQHLPDAYDPVLWHGGNITGRHPVQVTPGSLLGRLIGEGTVAVNSSHHQAIDAPGKQLTVVAAAPDGVVEAAEGENMILVQWHPERMLDTMLPLFQWLIGEK